VIVNLRISRKRAVESLDAGATRRWLQLEPYARMAG